MNPNYFHIYCKNLELDYKDFVEGKIKKSELKKKYNELVLKWHPDKNKNSKESNAKFQNITTSYETLCQILDENVKVNVNENIEKETIYDEVDIYDMEYDDDDECYYYPCPCGDRFFITRIDLSIGLDIAHCPSCTLKIKVVFDQEDLLLDITDDYD